MPMCICICMCMCMCIYVYKCMTLSVCMPLFPTQRWPAWIPLLFCCITPIPWLSLGEAVKAGHTKKYKITQSLCCRRTEDTFSVWKNVRDVCFWNFNVMYQEISIYFSVQKFMGFCQSSYLSLEITCKCFHLFFN